MSSTDKPVSDSPMTLTLRMIMNGKEVGSIIGKGGEIINSIREDSTAKIHITDGSVPERVVTVIGSTDSIFKAYTLMCKKLEDEEGGRSSGRDSRSSSDRGGLTLRLVVPATQCGSLIGKGGSKIKEIREVTGASIQVASDMLPGSTERSVTVNGSRDAVTQCIYHICCVMLESPAKGNVVQYQPGRTGFGPSFGGREGRGPPNPLAGLLGLGGGGASTLAAIASIAGSQINRRHDRGGEREERDRDRESTFNMSVANDLIGSVIGKGGTKIAEIRQISGAMIRISKSNEENSEGDERQIVITGNPDSVALAKSLINMSLDLHKANMEEGDRPEGEDNRRRRDRDDDRRDRYRGDRGGGHDMGLAGLLAKPEILAAVSTLAQLGGMGGGGYGGMGQVGGMSRSRSSYGSSGRSRDDDRRDTKRSKFAPY